MANKRTEILYRRVKIVAREVSGGWEARAFDGGKPATEIHTAQSEEAAIVAVKAVLDENAAKERAKREKDGFPTANHVCAALKRLRPHDGQLAMLEAHYRADDFTLTATQLAAAAGKDNYAYANSQYGILARDLADEMEYTPTVINPDDGKPVWTYTLATGARGEEVYTIPGEYLEWQWKLRPQVVEALKLYGFER